MFSEFLSEMKTGLNRLMIVIFVVFFLPNSAWAKNGSKGEIKSNAKQIERYQCKSISRADAIRKAKKQTDGKVVGIQLSEKGAHSVYRVRMLVGDKRVKTLSIRACR